MEKICQECFGTFYDYRFCPHCGVELIPKKQYDLDQAKNRRDEELEDERTFTMRVPEWEGEENG